MTRPKILDRLKGVQRAGQGWLAFCPAHNDQNKRSLSVGLGDDLRTLLKCHAGGCTPQEITAAVGMTMADLAPPSGNGRRAPRRKIVETYDYRDERGTLLYQVVRFEPKDFLCRRPDGKDWVWNITGVRVVPYRLPELAEARRVYIVEGEKDADRLATVDVVATTNHGGAGKWREAHTAALVAAAVPEVAVLRDNDRPGAAHQDAVARSCVAAGLRVKRVELPGLPPLRDKHGEDVADWLDQGHTVEELNALADQAPVFDPTTTEGPTSAHVEPELRREGLDLVLVWPDGVQLRLAAIRDGREGVRGELTVMQAAWRVSWGSWALSSTPARETLRRKLEADAPDVSWGDYLEYAAFHFTHAARQGEPIVTLTGRVSSPTREVLPRFLYEGEPTLMYADGDTGKSLSALALAVAVHSGASLPCGLTPARPVPAAYLDWETTSDTLDARVARLAAGLGVAVPAIVYKRMTRPLVDEVATLAADFSRRGIGFVVIDSKMYAVAGGDGAAFHEPITAFYNALRLFAPAASLVLNHITGADARGGGPARPFGGAFAFNGPRLIWEAKRDPDITDATAIAFTCRKANNLPRRPEPFGLRFQPGDSTITVCPFDLTEASPQIVAGATLPYRVRLALAHGPMTTPEIAEAVGISDASARTILRRMVGKGAVVNLGTGEGKASRWELAAQ